MEGSSFQRDAGSSCGRRPDLNSRGRQRSLSTIQRSPCTIGRTFGPVQPIHPILSKLCVNFISTLLSVNKVLTTTVVYFYCPLLSRRGSPNSCNSPEPAVILPRADVP